MPLQLGGAETARRQTILWNPASAAEFNEADARIAELNKRGFVNCIVDLSAGEATMDPPLLDPNKGMFRILTKNGDDHLIWDRRSGPEVKDAYKKFNDLMTSGYTAYAVMATGQRGHRITEFDPALEEIILVPGTMPG